MQTTQKFSRTWKMNRQMYQTQNYQYNQSVNINHLAQIYLYSSIKQDNY